uniref:NADH-ubiquinone oxidoreductase chain 1 n=1 Tax=Bathynomus sp. YS-2016 TaxID=1863031 RepID=A0A1L2F0N6_9CRUS|nr:NADH dehydrogenase subunit 1 [Bathynomus sp. YS-2016]
MGPMAMLCPSEFILAILTKLIILFICVLIGVAFVTIYERKILSYMQIRKGPNKVGLKGVLQPFSDALKLFTKGGLWLSFSNIPLYLASPVLSLGIMLLLWFSIPSSLGVGEVSLGLIFILCCLSVGVYPTLGAGWSSNSKYSLLGSLRAVAQMISYEVSLALILLGFILLTLSLETSDLLRQGGHWALFLSLPLAGVWLATSLAEMNRTPFDFAEGESELVSGFNTEYSGGGFALFFLAEYGSILFMSTLFVVIFLGGLDLSLLFPIKVAWLAFLFVWARGTLPRFRYDKLMSLAWKTFLPMSLMYLIFFLGLVYLLDGAGV